MHFIKNNSSLKLKNFSEKRIFHIFAVAFSFLLDNYESLFLFTS